MPFWNWLSNLSPASGPLTDWARTRWAYSLVPVPALLVGVTTHYVTASGRSRPTARPVVAQRPAVPLSRPTGAWLKPLVNPGKASKARAKVRSNKQSLPRMRMEHAFAFPDGSKVAFEDRPRRARESARRKRVVFFPGTVVAATEPVETFSNAVQATGLPTQAVWALQLVSQHEGGFDAVNTWDRARFSWGFIQFAGGRGLPLVLAYWKDRKPELFEEHLGQYGVDVQPNEEGNPECVLADGLTGEVLRGKKAEQAFGDQPLLTAVFIRAGRNSEVRRMQVEAAIEWYARPALEREVGGTTIASVFTSSRGLAAVFDRKVHEGNVGRLARAVETVQSTYGYGLAPAQLEDLALQQAVQEADLNGEWDIARRLRHIYETPAPV